MIITCNKLPDRGKVDVILEEVALTLSAFPPQKYLSDECLNRSGGRGSEGAPGEAEGGKEGEEL